MLKDIPAINKLCRSAFFFAVCLNIVVLAIALVIGDGKFS